MNFIVIAGAILIFFVEALPCFLKKRYAHGIILSSMLALSVFTGVLFCLNIKIVSPLVLIGEFMSGVLRIEYPQLSVNLLTSFIN